MDDNVKQLLSGAGGSTPTRARAAHSLHSSPTAFYLQPLLIACAALAPPSALQRVELQLLRIARSALFWSTPRIEELLGSARGSSICMIRLSGFSFTDYLSARLQP